MNRVSIVLNLSAQEYRALATIAGNRGIQSHVLVEQLVRHALGAPTRSKPASVPKPVAQPVPRPKYVSKRTPKRSRAMIRSDRDEQFVAVTKLHGRGLNDKQIAAELGYSLATVQRRRSQLKLPAQAQGRPKKTTTSAASAAETS
ncbi:hypothetical protein E3T37_03495 [Cryobacterium sp. TMT2-10]|uniref:hypothetical protein n=1 Tax=Cryobacterium sp. TMT2-10 TaxID=1259244 RepID=UPI00106D891D|nr:hypothetical protein [Cryobacterium sp. TMT2-10]TFD41729.1 hypothetical protein E3T37_03495 [Cryobacterium sp. TMT2-10]